MLKTDIRVAWRFLFRNKVFAGLSFLGLLLGFIVSLLLASYVTFQLSFDSFYPAGDQIYRVHIGEDDGAQKTYPATSAALYEDCGACVVARIKAVSGSIGTESKPFQDQKVYWADSSFFSVFGVDLLSGLATQALKKKNTAVITRRLADKLFDGPGSLIGRTIIFADLQNREMIFEVTGLIADLPQNSHLTFDVLLSYASLPESFPEYQYGWSWRGVYTYIRLNERKESKVLVDGYARKVQYLKQLPNSSVNVEERLHLVSLDRVHLFSGLSDDAESYGSIYLVYFLVSFACLIIFVSVSNYINLTTVSAVFRRKEIGLKKIVGADGMQIVVQFSVESGILFFSAFILAVFFLVIIYPYTSSISQLTHPLELIVIPQVLLVIIATLILGVLCSTLYAYYLLRKVTPVDLLKGSYNTLPTVSPARVIMTVQFFVAFVLFTGTFAVYKQIDFMRNRDLGIKINQVLVIAPPRKVDSVSFRADHFRTSISDQLSVVSATSTTQIPGRKFNTTVWGLEVSDRQYLADDDVEYSIIFTDEQFLPTFSIHLLAGRNFMDTDTDKVILNETACKHLGFKVPEDAINQTFTVGSALLEIVGVVQNYHHLSMREEIAPILILNQDATSVFFAVKLNTNNVRDAIAGIKRQWESTFPDNVFDHYFLDDSYNRQYQVDVAFGKAVGLIAILIFVITYLGLVGTLVFATQKRVKEISIRRLLGAGKAALFGLLSKDSGKQIIIALIPAIPTSIYALERWLARYPYRIDLGLDVFVLPLLVIITTSLSAIGFIILKFVRRSTVEQLRSE